MAQDNNMSRFCKKNRLTSEGTEGEAGYPEDIDEEE